MSSEPTLTAIPGILLRTVMRAVARVLLLLALLLLTGSFFLMTWRAARAPKQQALVDMVRSLLILFSNV